MPPRKLPAGPPPKTLPSRPLPSRAPPSVSTWILCFFVFETREIILLCTLEIFGSKKNGYTLKLKLHFGSVFFRLKWSHTHNHGLILGISILWVLTVCGATGLFFVMLFANRVDPPLPLFFILLYFLSYNFPFYSTLEWWSAAEDWPGLCLFCCYQPSCVVNQQSWYWSFLFHKLSILLPSHTLSYKTRRSHFPVNRCLSPCQNPSLSLSLCLSQSSLFN